jgi:hypothetical protein
LLILFGGITFTIKYLKFKKNKNSVPWCATILHPYNKLHDA